MQYSVRYILGFAVAICLVCSVLVAASAVALKDKQEVNKVLDRQKKVLAVVGLLEEGQDASADEVNKLFADNIRSVVVDLESGDTVELTPDELVAFDQAAEAADPATSEAAPKNKSGVKRIPKRAKIYELVRDGKVELYVLPVEGKGLWSTLYGFLALDADGNTIRGLTFYQHGETPGLGGEVDNPRWKALWDGRKVRNAQGEIAIHVKKGAAGPPAEAPHEVDGLSGATLTANGVTYLLELWLGPEGFEPFLKKATHGGSQS